MTHRVGIYPGTFDPVHQGHLAFCLEVINRGEIDEIVLLPERVPRGKPEVTALSERLDQLELATTQFPFLSVVSLKSNQFTVNQTLPELHELFTDAQLSLLIGSDIVRSLQSWENLSTLLRRVSLVVGMRGQDEVGIIETIFEQIGQAYAPVSFCLIETAHADVASSHIRSGRMTLDFQAIELMPAISLNE